MCVNSKNDEKNSEDSQEHDKILTLLDQPECKNDMHLSEYDQNILREEGK